MRLDDYRQIWLVDTEFHQPIGYQPNVLCLVAREYHTGRTVRYWADELAGMHRPPFPVDKNSLFVAYYASAELGCFLAVGWPAPERILDLYAEFRNHTNGRRLDCGNGLLGALTYFGLDAMCAVEKGEMRQLAVRGGPFTNLERLSLLDYCESDVTALSKLLEAMAPHIDLPRALLRGRYTQAVAKMERTGIPLDVATYQDFKERWQLIQDVLIQRVDQNYGLYEGARFKLNRFEAWLAAHGIPWPRHASGSLNLTEDAFRQMARHYLEVAPLHELRQAMAQTRLNDVAVGPDGRNRCLLSPYSSTTGRNQPSNKRFIFGPSCWMRGMIKPPPGRFVAYVDWSQQEFGIAAALSGDVAMMEAYRSGDPYLTFAMQAGAVPRGATRESHGRERNQFKICALAVQYGMSANGLAAQLGVPESFGRQLIQLHQETYPAYWKWSQAAIDRAMLYGRLHTVFGWQIHTSPRSNCRSLANFPVQANGAEMLRLACCLATERGIEVCAPIHDAILIEGPCESRSQIIAATQAAMKEASQTVLSGFHLESDAKVVTWPDRYMDERGAKMWNTVNTLVYNSSDSPMSHR